MDEVSNAFKGPNLASPPLTSPPLPSPPLPSPPLPSPHLYVGGQRVVGQRVGESVEVQPRGSLEDRQEVQEEVEGRLGRQVGLRHLR